MGMKYMIYGFNYPYRYYEASRQTRYIIVAIFWFIVYSLKYDGVDINKRGN
jgi:hypothetical protein